MPIVIRIGGSVVASPTNPELLNQYANLLKELRKKGCKTITVVGGGSLAREFIKIGEQLGVDEKAQDWLAIHVSRLYALLFILMLGKNATKSVPTLVNEAVRALKEGKIVVMGGLKPGMTTDSVAAQIALETNAHLLVKATDQNGIYNKDPRKHKNAIKLDEITFQDLGQVLRQDYHKAGIHQVLDPVAAKMLQKSRIKTVVVNGYNPRNIQYAIEGKKIGTTIMA
ncbi:MAG: UMP kinase [Candidatus Bathyarchaeota archaeon]|nr:MAG: UMP kinase [Candidatus Bathyarchaeota archaeon]